MENVPWSCIEAFDDVDDVWFAFQKLFFSVVDKHAPIMEKRVKAIPAMWINDDILNEMHHRDYLHKKALRSKEESDWLLFKASRNRVTSKIKQAKKDYLDEAILCSQNAKETWKRIKEFLPSSKAKGPASLNIDGSSIRDSTEMANAFNNFFASIGLEIGQSFDNSLPNVPKCNTEDPFTIPPLLTNFVKSQIREMNETKATGCDGMSVKLLKCAGDSIIQPLTFIFNLCISKGTFPTEWKRARVTPIFKAGDPHSVNNYRPVSILSCVSKILERHVHDTFYDYLSQNHLLSERQFGFRPNRCTETALISIADEWYNSINDGKLTGVMFIDVRKAFDTVNHHVLLHKLKSYGVSDKAMSFFTSYLSNRQQAVNFNGVLSDFKPINIGVPQGSILGPLFFILHVNDFPKCLKHSNVIMYADDTSLSTDGKTVECVEEKLFEDFLCTIQWMKDNKLSLNLDKTQCMLIGSAQKLARSSPLKIKVNDIVIQNVQSAKLLGVYVDVNLSWHQHINFMCKKIAKKLGVLRRLSSFMSAKGISKVYSSIVFPHFLYCSSVWSMPSNNTNIDRLYKLQKRAARILLGIRNSLTPTQELFNRLKWMPITDYFKYRKACLTFKIIHSTNPLQKNLVFVSGVSSRRTRAATSNKLYVPPTRTAVFKRSFTYSACILWNDLSAELRNCDNIAAFKKNYISNYYLHT